MHRFFLPPDQCQGSRLCLEGQEAHHASRVLRLVSGASVVILDGAGHELHCTLTTLGRRSAELLVRDTVTSPPLPFQLTLLQALPKGKLMDFIVQKATELGVTRIVPLLTERVVAQLDEEKGATRAEHWHQVAIEAIKQCGSLWLPKVEVPTRLEDWCARQEPFELSLLASLETKRVPPRVCFDAFQREHGRAPHSCTLYVGPEGDFSAEELAAIKAAGAQPISLGHRVLRVETAALSGVALLNYEWDCRHAPAATPGTASQDAQDA